VLGATTGWQVARVPALIPFQTFFELLASKRFPVATFIRTPEELDYLQEPDIFHEIFGHCPLLTNPWFAEFTHTYGKLGLAATKEQRVYLARLYWMTIEFGLMETPQGRKSTAAASCRRRKRPSTACPANPSTRPSIRWKPCARRTASTSCSPVLRPAELKRLFDLAHEDIMGMVHQAMQLGLHAPKFPPKVAA
jgi:phenylalanine-4-hydroxylase